MWDDLKFAWRRLLGSPGFTLVAVLTLALGVGANTAIFSIADAVLFRPFPYSDPDRVFILQMRDRQTGARSTLISYELVQAIDEHHRGLASLGMLESAPSLIVPADDGAAFVARIEVTANYFEVLGVAAARGRLFQSGDDGATGRPAVLSYAAWQQQFGADERVVGRAATLGTTTFDVIGVLPPDFVFPSAFAGRAEVVTVMPPVTETARGGTFNPIARLGPGVSREAAQAELDALAAQVAARNPKPFVTTPALDDVRSVLYPVGRPIMQFLLAAAGLVLLIGCGNLVNMLLARSHQHERETGVRAALGASAARMVRPLVFEALLIGLAGSAVAVLVTSLTFDALVPHVPPLSYRNAPIGVSVRVVVFALMLGFASSCTFAAVPAYRAARVDVLALIQGRRHAGRARRRRFGSAMVSVQVGLAIVLVCGTVAATRGFLSVLRVPLGFTPENVITIGVAPPRESKGRASQSFYVRLLDALSRRGDVLSAGAAGSMPLDGGAAYSGVPGPDRRMLAGIEHVLPGYFETVGIRLMRGRLPDMNDVASGADLAVISESAARVLFPNGDPLGGAIAGTTARRFTIIGVVSDVLKSLERPGPPPVYVIPNDDTRVLTLVARMRTDQGAAMAEVKRELSALAPGTPVTAIWWTDRISGLTAYRNPRFQTLVLGAFATLALALVAVGIFGVVAVLVAMRRHEMGIRLAIGATPRSLVGLMVGQALIPVGFGLVIAGVATPWLARLAEAQRFTIDVRDPAIAGLAVLTVMGTAAAAAYIPARRASRVDPVIVLRAE